MLIGRRPVHIGRGRRVAPPWNVECQSTYTNSWLFSTVVPPAQNLRGACCPDAANRSTFAFVITFCTLWTQLTIIIPHAPVKSLELNFIFLELVVEHLTSSIDQPVGHPASSLFTWKAQMDILVLVRLTMRSFSEGTLVSPIPGTFTLSSHLSPYFLLVTYHEPRVFVNTI